MHPVYYVIKEGFCACVELFIEHGVDPSDYMFRTMNMMDTAVYYRRYNVIRMLKLNGVHINQRNLLNSIKIGNKEMVVYLMHMEPSLKNEPIDDTLTTPLLYSFDNGTLVITEYMISQ